MPSLSQPKPVTEPAYRPIQAEVWPGLGQGGQGPGEKQGGRTVPVHPLGESGLCAFTQS